MIKAKTFGSFLVMMVVAAGLAWTTFAQAGANSAQERFSMTKAKESITAPDFPKGLEWLNTEKPLTLSALRGKVVLLDFWTYCCINCMHIIPDLKKLEAEYPAELVVVGVHSAKFAAEQETDNIRQAVLRYEIEHPVVNDRDMATWRQYGVQAWPTLVLIDPEGRIAGSMSGEGVYDILGPHIQKMVEVFDAEGKIDRKSFRLKLERDGLPETPLSFPGKVLADEGSKQLFIADSNHNRIIRLSLEDGELKDVIGSGRMGLTDGSFEQAMFGHPQGMAFDGAFLYVADTENHAIRRVDFKKRMVATIAGTGEQTHEFKVRGPGKEVALTSPWDVALHDHTLYIAMAGSHQIWRMDLKSGMIQPHAGSGREDIIDGPLPYAALAQPSGITTDGQRLYFADSEVSAIRAADRDLKGSVTTLMGGGLFKFGDRDGTRQDALLQHPLGVVYDDGVLYVADTYNNKIKRITLKKPVCETFLGSGEEGFQDGPEARFDEPGGLSVANGKLYIADTNNHAIRVADLKTKNVETLEIRGIEEKMTETPPVSQDEVQRLPAQVIAPGEGILKVDITFPPGFKLNQDAPSSVTAGSSEKGVVRFGSGGPETTLPLKISPVMSFTANEGQAVLSVRLVLYSCEEVKQGLCYFKEARLAVPVKVEKDANNHQLIVSYALPSPFPF